MRFSIKQMATMDGVFATVEQHLRKLKDGKCTDGSHYYIYPYNKEEIDKILEDGVGETNFKEGLLDTILFSWNDGEDGGYANIILARKITLDTPVVNMEVGTEGIDHSHCFLVSTDAHPLGEWLNAMLDGNGKRDDLSLDEAEIDKIKTILKNGGCTLMMNSVGLNMLPIFNTNHSFPYIGAKTGIQLIPQDEAKLYNETINIPTHNSWSFEYMPF